MRLLVTRPRPDAEAQACKLKALGHEAIVSPLLKVEFLEFSPLPLSHAQALIATSRNAPRALARSGDMPTALALPLFTVGPATAALARELGFSDIRTGPGSAEKLPALIASQCEAGGGALVHLAGTRIAFDLKGALEGKGFDVEQPLLYRSSSAERFSEEARAALASGALDGVILMSPATAQTFVALACPPDLREGAAKLNYFCLSRNVAKPLAALKGAVIHIARGPMEDDLLALIGHQRAN